MRVVVLLALLVGCTAMEVREPVSEAQMANVRNGMERAEVERLLGAPTGGTETYRSGETVSGWILPVRRAGVRASYFNVHYREGRVVRTSNSFDYLGG